MKEYIGEVTGILSDEETPQYILDYLKGRAEFIKKYPNIKMVVLEPGDYKIIKDKESGSLEFEKIEE